MWFCLQFNSQCLSALVGSHGILYWRLVDVGLMLGERKPYDYATRHGQRGKDVLPDGTYSSRNTQQSLVATTGRVYELLQMGNPSKAEAFRQVLIRGVGVVACIERYSQSYRSSPCLVLHPTGDVHFSSWIEQFIRDIQLQRTSWIPQDESDIKESQYIPYIKEESLDLSQPMPGIKEELRDLSQPDIKEEPYIKVEPQETASVPNIRKACDWTSWSTNCQPRIRLARV